MMFLLLFKVQEFPKPVLIINRITFQNLEIKKMFLINKKSSSDGMADKCSNNELFTSPLKLAFDRGGIVSEACSAKNYHIC